MTRERLRPSTNPRDERRDWGTRNRPTAPRDRSSQAGKGPWREFRKGSRVAEASYQKLPSPRSLSLPPARPPLRSQPIPGRYGTPRDPTTAPPLGPAADVQARQKVAVKLFVAEGAGDEARTLPASTPGAAAVAAPGGERPGAGGRGLASLRAPPRRHRGRLSREAGERGRVLTCLSSAWRVGKGGVGKEVGPPPAPPGAAATRGGKGGRGGREKRRRTGGRSRALSCVRGTGVLLREEEETPRPYGQALWRAPRPLLRGTLLPSPRPGRGSLRRRGGLAIPLPSWRPQDGAGRPPVQPGWRWSPFPPRHCTWIQWGGYWRTRRSTSGTAVQGRWGGSRGLAVPCAAPRIRGARYGPRLGRGQLPISILGLSGLDLGLGRMTIVGVNTKGVADSAVSGGNPVSLSTKKLNQKDFGSGVLWCLWERRSKITLKLLSQASSGGLQLRLGKCNVRVKQMQNDLSELRVLQGTEALQQQTLEHHLQLGKTLCCSTE